MTGNDTRAQEIRAELDRLAPLEGDTATSLARYCAMEGQVAWARLTGMDHEITTTDIAIILGYFAAAHALTYAAGLNSEKADQGATEIRDAWLSPPGAGEWVYVHLGPDAKRIAALAGELARVTAEPEPQS